MSDHTMLKPSLTCLPKDEFVDTKPPLPMTLYIVVFKQSTNQVSRQWKFRDTRKPFHKSVTNKIINRASGLIHRIYILLLQCVRCLSVIHTPIDAIRQW